MNRYFECLSDKDLAEIVSVIVTLARFSRDDGCYVISMRCMKCNELYEEELAILGGKITAREDLLCLDCDEVAAKKAFNQITVEIGWV